MGKGDLSGRAGFVVALSAAASSARALVAWLGWDAALLPDTALYAQGGLGIYPSPIGRLAGLGGELSLAIVNAWAAGVLVLLVAVLAIQLGGSAWQGAVLALITPLSLWTVFPGADALGAVFVLSAALLWLRRSRPASGLLAGVAVLTHAATLPLIAAAAIVLPASWRSRSIALTGVGTIAFAGLALTPYGGALYNLSDVGHAAKVAVVTCGTSALPFVPFTLRIIAAPLDVRRLLLVGLLGTAIAAGLQSGDRESNARYALPATMLFAVASAIPRARRPKVTQGAIVPELHTEPNCFCGHVARVHPWVQKSTGWRRGRCIPGICGCVAYEPRLPAQAAARAGRSAAA